MPVWGAHLTRLRDELLNQELFFTLLEAQVLAEDWRTDHMGVMTCTGPTVMRWGQCKSSLRPQQEPPSFGAWHAEPG